MEAFSYTTQDIDREISQSELLGPESLKIDVSYLLPDQQEIASRALLSTQFIRDFSSLDTLPTDSTPESRLFEELCFSEISPTIERNQLLLSPSDTRLLLSGIARRLGLRIPPIESDGILIEHDGQNAYLMGIYEYTLSSDLKTHKSAQIDRYKNKNNELEFLSSSEGVASFNQIIKNHAENFPANFNPNLNKSNITLMLSYLATPNHSFPDVQTLYSSFSHSEVRKIASILEKALHSGDTRCNNQTGTMEIDQETVIYTADNSIS